MSIHKTDQSLRAGQMVAEARKTISEITVTQAREELDQGQAGLLLDVREPAEWERGHIPGALLAAQTLQSMGYTNVVSMTGGFNEWSKQGFPVEAGTGGRA